MQKVKVKSPTSRVNKRSKSMKDLMLATKARLLIANGFNDAYAREMVFSESSYALLIHLFGLGFALKVFGNAKKVSSPQNLKFLVQTVKRKLLETAVPRTAHQAIYQAIKRHCLKAIRNLLENLAGFQGTPHATRRLRNLIRRLKAGEYITSRQKRGNWYQH